MEVQLRHPFSMMICGGRGAGKSFFTKNLIKYRNSIVNKKIQRIVWCYGKHQPQLLAELKSYFPNIEYIHGLPSDLDEMFDITKTNLLVLDDLMDQASSDQRISQLFTRGRHQNLSLVYLTQNLFLAKQRTISLNSDYIVVFKNARDQSQFHHLAKQFLPDNSKFLFWAFKDSTKKPYSYIFLDTRPETIDKYRVRTNILPNEAPQFVYIPS